MVDQDFREDHLYLCVMDVSKTWDKVKEIPDYRTVAGEILFRKIFDLAPGAWKMFSFGKDTEEIADEFFQNKAFITHAKTVVGTVDAAIHLLGPDFDLLKEILLDLGSRHVAFGVMPEHYPIVGAALLHTLEVALADRFTPKVKNAWARIFGFISRTMMEGASECLRLKLGAYVQATKAVS